MRDPGLRTPDSGLGTSDQGLAIHYHNSFRPNCSCLGAFAWPVMTPNDVDVTLVFGAENWTRLNAFSASTRNCAVTLGLTAKFLKNERSKFCTPCARSTGEKIGSFPNVNAAGWL